MDDSPIYTGVDGVFGNSDQEESVKDQVSEQERLIQELTPQLQDIIQMIDNEKALAIQFIADNVDSGWTKEDLEYEAKAAGRYRNYLDGLKTQFTLKLNRTQGK